MSVRLTTESVDLKGALRQYFGFDKFKGSQEEIINNLLKGKNTFVIMPTGGGKSLCYQLPSFLLPGVSIIVSSNHMSLGLVHVHKDLYVT